MFKCCRKPSGLHWGGAAAHLLEHFENHELLGAVDLNVAALVPVVVDHLLVVLVVEAERLVRVGVSAITLTLTPNPSPLTLTKAHMQPDARRSLADGLAP